MAFASFQQTIGRIRSRIDWLSEGDANASFFHSHARYRKRKNYIAKLQVADRVLTRQEEKDEAVWDFYCDLIGKPKPRTRTLDLAAFYHQPQNMQDLDAPISEEEVWTVIKAMPPDKASGRPDGFTGRFYKECWEIIKGDIMAAIGAIHAGGSRMLGRLNSAFLVLIPKRRSHPGCRLSVNQLGTQFCEAAHQSHGKQIGN